MRLSQHLSLLHGAIKSSLTHKRVGHRSFLMGWLWPHHDLPNKKNELTPLHWNFFDAAPLYMPFKAVRSHCVPLLSPPNIPTTTIENFEKRKFFQKSPFERRIYGRTTRLAARSSQLEALAQIQLFAKLLYPQLGLHQGHQIVLILSK